MGNVYWGAGIGAVVAIVVLARALSRRKAHLFDYVGVIYFIGMLVLLAILHPTTSAPGVATPKRWPTDPVRDRVRVRTRQPALHRGLRP